jgi:hypothetical protein
MLYNAPRSKSGCNVGLLVFIELSTLGLRAYKARSTELWAVLFGYLNKSTGILDNVFNLFTKSIHERKWRLPVKFGYFLGQ